MSIWCFFLFGVLLINGQCHYLVFFIWPHIWVGDVLVLQKRSICLDIFVRFLVFYKHDHLIWCYCNFGQSIIDNSVCFLFGVIAICAYVGA